MSTPAPGAGSASASASGSAPGSGAGSGAGFGTWSSSTPQYSSLRTEDSPLVHVAASKLQQYQQQYQHQHQYQQDSGGLAGLGLGLGGRGDGYWSGSDSGGEDQLAGGPDGSEGGTAGSGPWGSLASAVINWSWPLRLCVGLMHCECCTCPGLTPIPGQLGGTGNPSPCTVWVQRWSCWSWSCWSWCCCPCPHTSHVIAALTSLAGRSLGYLVLCVVLPWVTVSVAGAGRPR